MANDAKKISELATTTSLSANDRIVILANPSSSPNVKTISVSNLIPSLVTSNTFNPNFTTNTGNVLVGMTQSGSYTKFGKLCYFRTYFNFANVTSFADGSGQYQITLPFPSVATISIRGGSLHNPNTASIYHIGGVLDTASNSSTLSLYYSGSTTDLAWKNTTPVSWSSGNSSHFDISGIYETT